MAILYGTQSNGETLPVLVDQFGNLLAKGIEGPEGPEGPPGIGQLPPDPYEGAILGWEDGELAWIGGSVPLPEGTYGPYVYIEDEGMLVVPQDASGLVNGQQLFMSDPNGDQISVQFATDTIASVISGYVTTPVTMEAAWTGYAGGNWLNTDNWSSLVPSIAFGGNGGKKGHSIAEDFTAPHVFYIGDFESASRGASGWALKFPSVVKVNLTAKYDCTFTVTQSLTETISQGLTVQFDKNSTQTFTGQVFWYNIPSGFASAVDTLGTLNSIGGGSTLTFPEAATNFDKFERGDVVQDPDVKITDINATVPSITVDGGSWSGSDGSSSGGGGSPSPGATYLENTWSGQGSVSLGSDGAILLRNDNEEWVDDFYVTAPEQRIAARKVATTAIRKKKK